MTDGPASGLDCLGFASTAPALRSWFLGSTMRSFLALGLAGGQRYSGLYGEMGRGSALGCGIMWPRSEGAVHSWRTACVGPGHDSQQSGQKGPAGGTWSGQTRARRELTGRNANPAILLPPHTHKQAAQELGRSLSRRRAGLWLWRSNHWDRKFCSNFWKQMGEIGWCDS
jgi:hypothetical protein